MIKNELLKQARKYGITSEKMAKDLKLSRPTLYHYAAMYAAGEPIPRLVYQQAFEILFPAQETSYESFHQSYRRAVWHLNKSFVDRTARCYYHDMEVLFDENKLLCEVQVEMIDPLITYFRVLNGIEPIEGIEENTVKLFANFYRLFFQYKTGRLPDDAAALDEFIRVSKFEKKHKQCLT